MHFKSAAKNVNVPNADYFFILANGDLYLHTILENGLFKLSYKLPVQFAMLEHIRKEKTKTGFKLTRNQASYQFFYEDQSQKSLWVKGLSLFCFKKSFDSKYSLCGQIGSGATATVYKT